MTQSDRSFVDICVYIAKYHPASKRNSFENDICIKSGLLSFKDSMEYRDNYLIISTAIDDNAIYVEYVTPINKVVVLIDGVGTVGTIDPDYQYLLPYVINLYKGVYKMVQEQAEALKL